MTDMNDEVDEVEQVEDEGGEGGHLDQLQSDDTLVDRGLSDVLDEGYIAPDTWSPGQGFGNTAEEMRQGETIEQREKQEQPEVVKEHGPWNPDGEDRQVGSQRAGRLVAPDQGGGEDTESESVGRDVGIDGGAASAEEAAMHIFHPDVDPDE